MRKSVKIVSALLVLVMLMAQVVCMSAAGAPGFTWSAEQVDHFDKKITAKLYNGEEVTKVWMRAYKEKNTEKPVGDPVGQDVNLINDEHTTSYFTISMTVEPNVAKYIRVVADMKDGTSKEFWYTVGGNSYYNPGSSSVGTSKPGNVWTGTTSGNSGNVWTGTVSGGSNNIWDTYDPDAWYGYRDEAEDPEDDYDLYYVTCRSLNVRNGAGTKYDRVGSLKRYDTVKVYDIEDGWAVIEYKDRLRYVSEKYLAEY